MTHLLTPGERASWVVHVPLCIKVNGQFILKLSNMKPVLIQVDSQMKDAIKEIIVEFWMTKHIILRY